MKEIEGVVFDWGDTLMMDFQEFDGPMCYWEKVQLMPNIKDTLLELSKSYPLYVATNAGASNKELVLKAFRRVEINGYFKDVFTSKDLGYEKPNRNFFIEIIRKLGVSSNKVVMIGNDYKKDIVGAKEAGMKTILYNPKGLSGNFNKADIIIDDLNKLVNIL